MRFRLEMLYLGPLAAIVFSILAIIGHIYDIPSLASWVTGDVPMQINAAIGLILGAFTLLAIYLKRLGVACIIGISSIMLGTLSLMSYLPYAESLNIIHNLFLPNSISTLTPILGRPSIGACILLITNGMFGVCAYSIKKAWEKLVCLGCLTGLAFGLSIDAFVTYCLMGVLPPIFTVTPVALSTTISALFITFSQFIYINLLLRQK